MHDKRVMVTGATAGIGKYTALAIARMGAHVVLVGRSEAKCREVTSMIQNETGNHNVEYMLADLSSIEQTRAVVEQYKAKYDRLDVLVNNVGAIFLSRGETVDGIENTFALNHLVGYFLLTNLLLDVIKASAPARIVNVSSAAHMQGILNFGDLEATSKYGAMGVYANSKLANVLFTYELARRLEGSGVATNALHPGVVASNFGVTNNSNMFTKIFRRVFNLISISEEKGAETSIYLATSPEVEGVTAKYFSDKQAVRSSEASYREADQQRLWAVSEEMSGIAVGAPS
ncbi:MAG: SDR family oxidoreductase [Chloroflexi bacterium AL-W]|nr:SDR family oxidoreductase [Chloroflexi bacterium AL-N1]NOK69818.1 SDR family oxidoreductase [Chloroflexi bacterium AL-N10]NOK73578.1 SDR family oxidoreductase [Chloroflexi bacterium AL-N5]NOK83988.1 SDR family oxidoreductase [Chloroflexi bacterium AL-W]NOK87909.1 SDR family oxidoreductase [Chloroflexi bacterium AL-N15]